MRKYVPLVVSAGVLAMFLQTSSPTQGQSTDNAKPRLVAELTDAGGGALTLNVTFYGTQPKPDQAEETLRKCLEAAAVMHAGEDISAKAWFRVSADSSRRRTVALTGGAESLLYVAKDQSIRYAGDDATPSANAAAGASDDVATIVRGEKIVKACREFPQDQLPVVASVGLAKRGQKRRDILKAMRAWCNENDIVISRKVRVCTLSIAKAVVAMKSSPSIAPEDLAAAILRGKASFTGSNNCVKCHQAGGRGGRRGPNLADDEWLHCDGSIEGIKKVILAGVPKNKLKNKAYPFAMNAATNLASNDKDLADLAAYVHSLSQD